MRLFYSVSILIAAILFLFSIGMARTTGEEKQTVETGYIEVDGGKLYYEMTGSGKPIMFIHDGLVHHEIWDSQFEYFAKTNLVIRYDRRGYGNSPQAEQAYSKIDDLNVIFETLNIESAMLFGMSAGGRLAIDFTLEFPDKVNGLVLVGAVVSGFGYTNHFYTRGGHRPANLIASADTSYLNYWTDIDPYEMWSGSTEGRKKLKELLQAYPNNGDPGKFRHNRTARRQAIDHLSEIKVPTIILVGEFDMPDVHAHAGALQAGIKGSKRIIVEKTGHLIPIERPDFFNEAVVNALGELNFQKIYDAEGVDAAVGAYWESVENADNSLKINEGHINGLGYNKLSGGNINDALLLFELNVKAFPNSFNVYDSYGEALLANGDTINAIINYKKSLELGPANSNAEKVLNSLESK